MALRGIDSQIMITKSQEISADRNKINQNNSMMQGQMAQELQKDSSRVDERTHEVSEAENAKIGLDERGGKSGAGQEEEAKKRQEEEAKQEELSAAAQKLINLPVERGRYARREEHRIDIIV